MRQKSIEVEGLSHHGAPIPTACRVGPILVTSRIMGKDPDTGQMPSDPESQAELCFANLKRVLKAGGMDLGDVVKLTVYLVERLLSHRGEQAVERALPRSREAADARFAGDAAARREPDPDRSLGGRQEPGRLSELVTTSRITIAPGDTAAGRVRALIKELNATSQRAVAARILFSDDRRTDRGNRDHFVRRAR